MVFKNSPARVTWDNIVLAIVMTATFVRHATDGNRSPHCIEALVIGLTIAMERLKTSVAKQLTGWVS